MDNMKAKEKLLEFKATTRELREKEEEMKFGLDIFEIEPIVYHELSLVEKEMTQLFEIWGVKEEWDGEWDSWKVVSFRELKIDDMDDRAVEFQEKIKNFDKEVRQWGVFDFLKNKIDQFRTAMPLIADLRDEAMRDRHWKELKFEVKEEFDEESEEFTLEKIFDLGLNNHGEKIAELADNARKELKIELQLKEIQRIWENDPATDLDVKQSKSKANNEDQYKIMSTENVYGIIENHVVMLTNMKSSPYYKQFDDKIDFWENNIAQITETLELLLSVQGKWSYLESIFRGQADITKMLPTESSVFNKVHVDFKVEMERINKDRNAYRALIVKGFINILQELNRKLETIQK
jgi:dynein heavy chain